MTVDDIKRHVAACVGIRAESMKSLSLDARAHQARKVAIYLAWLCTSASTPAIARAFGLQCHTGVLHHRDDVMLAMKRDPMLALMIDDLRAALRSSERAAA